MSRYVPKPGPAKDFSIILASYGGRSEVVATCEPKSEMLAIAGVREARPKLKDCQFSYDSIRKEGS